MMSNQGMIQCFEGQPSVRRYVMGACDAQRIQRGGARDAAPQENAESLPTDHGAAPGAGTAPPSADAPPPLTQMTLPGWETAPHRPACGGLGREGGVLAS